jgi:hypothetical protein
VSKLFKKFKRYLQFWRRLVRYYLTLKAKAQKSKSQSVRQYCNKVKDDMLPRRTKFVMYLYELMHTRLLRLHGATRHSTSQRIYCFCAAQIPRTSPFAYRVLGLWFVTAHQVVDCRDSIQSTTSLIDFQSLFIHYLSRLETELNQTYPNIHEQEDLSLPTHNTIKKDSFAGTTAVTSHSTKLVVVGDHYHCS